MILIDPIYKTLKYCIDNRSKIYCFSNLRPSRIAVLIRKTYYYYEFNKNNRQIQKGHIVIRPGMQFKVNEDSMYSFKFFCYQSVRMRKELDIFLDMTKELKVFVDVGALHGIFSLIFANRPETKVYAFEPSPMAYQELKQNLLVNQIDNISSYNIALGDSEGEIRMSSMWQHLVAISDNDKKKFDNDSVFNVKISTIDKFFDKQNVKVDAIKIDVEGYEYHVLLGARNILLSHRPILFLEIHQLMLNDHGIDIETVEDILDQMKYKIYSNDLKEIYSLNNYYKENKFEDEFNVICKPF